MPEYSGARATLRVPALTPAVRALLGALTAKNVEVETKQDGDAVEVRLTLPGEGYGIGTGEEVFAKAQALARHAVEGFVYESCDVTDVYEPSFLGPNPEAITVAMEQYHFTAAAHHLGAIAADVPVEIIRAEAKALIKRLYPAVSDIA